MKINGIKGVKDILPGEIEKWQWVEEIAHKTFARYGFKEIRIPIFESTRLFQRSIGETTDIVEKEMYTFEDKGGDSLTLRPEGTASVVRSFVEHKMYGPGQLSKLYYIGPMFRYERPQAGRFRQFYQIGVEAMGSGNPALDAEVISMLMEFYQELGLKGLQLNLNTLGSGESRTRYREILKEAIKPNLSKLCANCQGRYERNPLRVLDCKNESCGEVAVTLPKIRENLIEEDLVHFNQVQEYLKSVDLDFIINDRLVRGLDYYGRTTFEVTAEGLGAQNAVCGGGRYDSLVEEFEGPATPCFGFAMGLERLVSILPEEVLQKIQSRPDVFIVMLGEQAEKAGFKLMQGMRVGGLSVTRDFENGSMKSQLRKANKSNCRFAVILGENEILNNSYQLKNMETGEQSNHPPEALLKEICSP